MSSQADFSEEQTIEVVYSVLWAIVVFGPLLVQPELTIVTVDFPDRSPQSLWVHWRQYIYGGSFFCKLWSRSVL
jgi:hypothetical protein